MPPMGPSIVIARLGAGRCGRPRAVAVLASSMFLVLSSGLPGQEFPTPVTTSAPTRVEYPIDPDAAPRPVLRAQRVDGTLVVIDGVMSEPEWSSAEVASSFMQNRPRAGYPAGLKTEAKILYDSRNLYVGAILYDDRPDLLITAGLEHDFQPMRGELFAVLLDPFLDRRNAYGFGVNPGGAMMDSQSFDNGRTVVRAWDAAVETATSVTESGWLVEMRIPFSAVSFNPERDGQPWGVNFVRIIGRSSEISTWAPLQVHDITFVMSKGGYLVGLQGLEPGRNLRIKPFALSNYRKGSLIPGEDRGSEFDGGIDAKYAITPRLTLDLTYRTDFSQVEVDQEQLNLSRFSPFFPERREFFIENEGVFAFGDILQRSGLRSGTTAQDFRLFHSRRIGLGEDGRPIPLLGGGRLTGRAGPLEFGFLNLQSELTSATAAENFSVARVKARLLADSDVGFLFTERRATQGDAGEIGYNRSFGVDANLRLLDRLVISSYLAGSEASGTESDGIAGRGIAGRLGVGWRDSFFNTSVTFRRFDDRFDPGLGFLRRGGVHHYYGTFGVHPRVSVLGLSEVNPYVEAHYFTKIDGTLESRERVGALTFTFLQGGSLDFEHRDRFERIEQPFQIFEDIVVDPGDYHFAQQSLIYRTSQSRTFTGSLTFRSGEFFSGTRRAVALGGTWRPRYDLFFDLQIERNDVDLGTGSFLADIASFRANYALSTRLFGSASTQYNTQTDQLVTNARINVRWAPLSDVFLVFQDRREIGTGATLERLLALKVTRLLQL